MKKNKKDSTQKDKGTMLTQKTNEDFNKKQPVPNDFKESNRELNDRSPTKLKSNKPKK